VKKSFQACDKKGFHLTFPNGIVLSTQFGPGNYGDNYDSPFDGEKSFDANMVEVAIFKADGCSWITKEYRDLGDDVLGRIDFGEWLKIFD
jgi:hypothetical protein